METSLWRQRQTVKRRLLSSAKYFYVVGGEAPPVVTLCQAG